jgi:glucosylceramidase
MRKKPVIIKIVLSLLIYCLACEKSATPVDNEAPNIELSYLEEYTYQAVSGTISIEAVVTDNENISYVEFYIIINDEHQLLDSINETPFILEWDTDQFEDCNTFLIYAKVFDESDNSNVSDIHLFNVDNSSNTDISVQVWLTEGVGLQKLEPQTDRYFGDNCNSVNVVEVNDGDIYQGIDGFGAALTHSSAYLINNSPNRDLIIEKLFSKTDGIGISYIRLAMGASDFVNGSHFSYDDTPGDTDLSEFSIDQDRVDVIPVLNDILAINPDLKIVASPWSAPGWMKTTGSMIGGQLLLQYYEVYANYFLKFLQEYQLEGIFIEAITVQNEPGYTGWDYPGMSMNSQQQAAFIKNNLGPTLFNNGLNTKIQIFDHNWGWEEDENTDDDLTSGADYVISIYNDPEAAQYIDGSAWHGYGGDVYAQSLVYYSYPDKNIYFTERTNSSLWEDWDGVLGHMTKYYFINVLNNWSKNVLLWNLVLEFEGYDENGSSLYGPNEGGCGNCTGLINIVYGELFYEADYYITGHFSKFVDTGAVRIGTDEDVDDIDAVTFRNPDGSHVMVAVNIGYESKSFFVIWNDMSFYYNLPGQGLVTFKW